jgi:hypothetical protein
LMSLSIVCYRPTDVRDVARAFRAYAERVLDGRVDKDGGSLRRVSNFSTLSRILCWRLRR